MNAKEKLLKRLPKKYHNRVRDFYEEDGLTDDCKYMFSWTNDFCDCEGEFGGSWIFESITEAIDFIKNELFTE